LVAGRGSEDRAGSSAVDERLNVGVAAIGRDGKTRKAVGVGGRAIVDATDSAGGCGGKDELPVLHHQAGREFQLLDKGDGGRTAVELELSAGERNGPIGIGHGPQGWR
jgi:hypothetical protein